MKKYILVIAIMAVVFLGVAVLSACQNTRTGMISNSNDVDPKIAAESNDNQQDAKEFFCDIETALGIPAQHQRYVAKSIFYPVDQTVHVWRPSDEQLSLSNKQITKCLAQNYCNEGDEIFRRRVELAQKVFNRLNEYWFFYTGVTLETKNLIVYGFFLPEIGEEQALGGEDAVWEKYIGATRGGGSKYWQIHFDVDSGECRAQIN